MTQQKDLENLADDWEEQQEALRELAEESKSEEQRQFEQIADGLTDGLLIKAYGIAYHTWQEFGDPLEEDLETEAYREELLNRMGGAVSS